MEKIFNDLTEKIKKYKELSGNSNIEVSNSGANKLEEEISLSPYFLAQYILYKRNL